MSNTINVDQFDLQRFAEWIGEQNLKFDGINKWTLTQDPLDGIQKISPPKQILYTTEQLVSRWVKENIA